MGEFLSMEAVRFVAIVTVIFTSILVTLMVIEVSTRGRVVAVWLADYSRNRDGTGKRVERGGVFYENRASEVPPTVQAGGDLDFVWAAATGRSELTTYYVVPSTVQVFYRPTDSTSH